MVKHRAAAKIQVTRWSAFPAGLALGAFLLLSFPAPAESYGRGETRHAGRHRKIHPTCIASHWEAFQGADGTHELPRLALKKKRSRGQREDGGGNWEDFQNLTPEEKARIRQKQREWESLPPERREMLRRRMEQLKQLPLQDRELFRRRFNQWQELSPQERRGIRNNLDKWDRLSPREQEKIRRKFLK